MKRRAMLMAAGAAALGSTAARAKSACPPSGGGLWFETYQDEIREWRWRLRAANGGVIATPGEGYSTRAACEEAIDVVKSCRKAPVC